MLDHHCIQITKYQMCVGIKSWPSFHFQIHGFLNILFWGLFYHLITHNHFHQQQHFPHLANITVSTVCRLTGDYLQMARKRGGPPLRKEIDNIFFLQSHPEVHKCFSDAGCMTYVERLQEGYHQAIE